MKRSRAKLLFVGFVSSGVMTVFTMKVLKIRGYQPSIVQQSSYTSYLSLISLILLLEKNCHVEKLQLSMYDNCGEIENFSTFGEISDVSIWQMWRNLKFSTYGMRVMSKTSTYIQNLCIFFKLCAFMWRKIEPKSTFVGEKWQIWGLAQISIKFGDAFFILMILNIRYGDALAARVRAEVKESACPLAFDQDGKSEEGTKKLRWKQRSHFVTRSP